MGWWQILRGRGHSSRLTPIPFLPAAFLSRCCPVVAYYIGTKVRAFFLNLVCLLALLLSSNVAAASEYRGQVTFGGLPVPGATVTVTQGAKKVTTVSEQGGIYSFPDLADGAWQIEIEMLCFSTIHAEITVSPATPAAKWELTLLPLDQIAKLTTLPPAPLPTAPLVKRPAASGSPASSSNDQPAEIPKPADDASQQSSDGFLVNGSVNNAATSRFSIDQAFGNRRFNSRSLYNGGLEVDYDNSALDARSYSLSGLESPKPSYNTITGILTFGGPLKIPHLLPRGPTFFVGYEWTRNHLAETDSGLVPTDAERTGDLSGLLNAIGQPITIYNPATGLPYPGNVVPVSPQAQALLHLYPLPNITGTPLYNYQVPVLNNTHQDELLSRLDKSSGAETSSMGASTLRA